MQPTNKIFHESYLEKRGASIQKTKKNQTLKPLEVEKNSPALSRLRKTTPLKTLDVFAKLKSPSNSNLAKIACEHPFGKAKTLREKTKQFKRCKNRGNQGGAQLTKGNRHKWLINGQEQEYIHWKFAKGYIHNHILHPIKPLKMDQAFLPLRKYQ